MYILRQCRYTCKDRFRCTCACTYIYNNTLYIYIYTCLNTHGIDFLDFSHLYDMI